MISIRVIRCAPKTWLGEIMFPTDAIPTMAPTASMKAGGLNTPDDGVDWGGGPLAGLQQASMPRPPDRNGHGEVRNSGPRPFLRADPINE